MIIFDTKKAVPNMATTMNGFMTSESASKIMGSTSPKDVLLVNSTTFPGGNK